MRKLKYFIYLVGLVIVPLVNVKACDNLFNVNAVYDSFELDAYTPVSFVSYNNGIVLESYLSDYILFDFSGYDTGYYTFSFDISGSSSKVSFAYNFYYCFLNSNDCMFYGSSSSMVGTNLSFSNNTRSSFSIYYDYSNSKFSKVYLIVWSTAFSSSVYLDNLMLVSGQSAVDYCDYDDADVSTQDFTYTIKYYFNDVYDSSYDKELTYTGLADDVIDVSSYIDSSIDDYYLKDDNTYTLVAGTDDEINIYYINDMYNKQYYTLNVYLDDVYFQNKSVINAVGEIGSTIDVKSILPSTINDIYNIEDIDYDYVINDDKEQNIYTVNYFSEYYGTDYQLIDLSDSRLYLAITPYNLIEIFPNFKFTHFTQFEQLIIIIGLNILFYLFIFFIFILVMRLFSKLLAWFF